MKYNIDYSVLQDEATKNGNAMHPAMGKARIFPRAMAVSQARHLQPLKKLTQLQLIADELCGIATPNSACREGCSHCCNMAVSVSPLEAYQIATHLKIKPAKPKACDVLEDRSKYTNVPCTFLKGGRCEIYAVRPITCRLYFNLSDTSCICDMVDNEGQEVPTLDTRSFAFAQFHTMGIEYHDIRDWFPKGSGNG